MISDPKNLTEQLQNLSERIAVEMRALNRTKVSKVNGQVPSSTGEVTISSVNSATKATQDALGNVIADTYATKTELGGKASKEAGVYYVEGTGTTAGVWLGSHSSITAYYEGLVIAYKIGVAGASSTTLDINGLGAVSVVRNVSTSVSTAYAVNSVVMLVYTIDGDKTYWKVADYDSDTKTRTSNNPDKKMFLVGATSQSTSGQTTYSNSACYIGTDNCLYSGGEKVSTTDTNTTYSLSNNGSTITLTGSDGSTDSVTLDVGSDYTLPTATDSVLGGVKIGSNITNNSGTISVSQKNVTDALGYTPLQNAPVTSVDGKTGAIDLSGTYQPKGNYLTSAPVTKVNGQTGEVTIDVGVKTVNGTAPDSNGNVTIEVSGGGGGEGGSVDTSNLIPKTGYRGVLGGYEEIVPINPDAENMLDAMVWLGSPDALVSEGPLIVSSYVPFLEEGTLDENAEFPTATKVVMFTPASEEQAQIIFLEDAAVGEEIRKVVWEVTGETSIEAEGLYLVVIHFAQMFGFMHIIKASEQ